MIDPKHYMEMLLELGLEFYAGVPDSVLEEFCACVNETVGGNSHVISANEGGAIGLAIGHHIGTGKVPVVYMQNSGLGNAVNPLISLASPEVYSVPILLFIGWRGEPGVKDEPQHVHQGRVMMNMLETMDIPAVVLSSDQEIAAKQTLDAMEQAKTIQGPVAIVVKKGLFTPYEKKRSESQLSVTREAAIIEVASTIEQDAVIIATTGMASRELYEYRTSNALSHERDFLTVGGMGHASQIATGIAMSQPNRKVYCFDGDGAAIMHMGSLGISGMLGVSNLQHIVFNNGAHGSVGGQPTIGFSIDLCQIARACGYRNATRVDKLNEIAAVICSTSKNAGPQFIEIRTRPENRADIGRPKSTPVENKIDLMRFLEVEQ
jgi:phosphonopyruvate decarboxylase